MQFLRIGNKNVLRGGTDGGISVVARVGHPRYRSWPTGAGGPCHIAFGVEKCDTLGGLRTRAMAGGEVPVNTQIEQALQSLKSGDQQEAERALETLQGVVYGFGMKVCGSHEDAQDTAQETLIRLARQLK